MKWTSFFIIAFLSFTQNAFGFDVVFNLPSKLPHDEDVLAILTVFHVNTSERLSISLNIMNEVNRRKIFSHQISILVSSEARTVQFPIRASPRTREFIHPGPGEDVLCYSLVQVTVATSSGVSWSQEQRIPVVKRKGHIFIQTDRPIYRPGDEVYVRFVPVDETLRPLSYAIDMSILAPNPTIGGEPLSSWTKRKTPSNLVVVRSFRLPSTPPLGKWTVQAQFVSDTIGHEVFTVPFYVQEYSLPTFELMIRPSKEDFILPDDQEFSAELFANFVYGKPVDGTVNMRFGLLDPNDANILESTYIITREIMNQGNLKFTVPVANLAGRLINTAILAQEKKHLFIEASVTERASGKTRSLRNSDVVFTSSPIILNLDHTSKYYKPGLPLTIRLSATFVNGSVVSNINVDIVVMGVRKDGRRMEIFRKTLLTCAEGTLLTRFDAPNNTADMTVQARAHFTSIRGTRYPSETVKQLLPQVSSYDEFVQIVLPRDKFLMGVMAPVEVYMTSTNKTVVYTITSGNNFIMEGKVKASARSKHVLITFPVVAEMSPTSHLAVYYVATSASGDSFIVADSATLRFEQACEGIEPDTNILFNENTLPYPGSQLNVEVTAEPRSYIGLTGIDAAALSLESEYSGQFKTSASNTRNNAFDVLRSFLPGCKFPTIPFPESAFQAIGRSLVTSVSHNYVDASRQQCENALDSSSTTSKRKRAVSQASFDVIHKAERFLGLAYECCAIGSNDVSLVMTFEENTCERRSELVVLGDECKKAFLECCHEAECIRNNPTRTARPCIPTTHRISHQSTLAASSDDSFVFQQPFQMLRRNFAHTWFNLDFRLGSRGRYLFSNSSNQKIPRLPDSITAWSVETFTLSQDRGMCVAEPLTFAVSHSLYLEIDIPREPVVRGTQVVIEGTLYSYLPSPVQATIILEAEDKLCAGAKSGQDSRPITHSLEESSNGTASTGVVRFVVIPSMAGDYRIKVKVTGVFGTQNQQLQDKVVKTLHVVPEGEPHKTTKLILIDTREKRRNSSRRTRGATLRSNMLNLAFPSNTVPGSEKATMRLYSMKSAYLCEPIISQEDGASNTIAQYLYTLQSIVFMTRNSDITNVTWLTELTNRAQTAYDGLLAYARDLNPRTNSDRDDRHSEALYGFSFSPADVAKPDLWLTCETLRLLCQVSELIELEPDSNIIAGSLRWLLSHQNSRKGYFSENREQDVLSRRKRSNECSRPPRSYAETKVFCRKYAKILYREKGFGFCIKLQRRCLRRHRRSAYAILQSLPPFKKNLNRKIYRSAVISSSLSSVLWSVKRKRNGVRRPRAFDYVNEATLRTALRKAAAFIRRQIMKKRNTDASPITLTASARALFLMTGRTNSLLERSIFRYKMEDGDTMWIKSNPGQDISSLSLTKQLQVRAADIESTAYMLYLASKRGLRAEGYANWLLMQRKKNCIWMSLRDTLASIIAMDSFASGITSQESGNVRVQVLSPGMPNSFSLIPLQETNRENHASSLDLPVTNNAVSMTTIGNGKAWLELSVEYNTPDASSSPPPTSTPIVESIDTDAALCPYNVTVTMKRTSVPTTFLVRTRTALSDEFWTIDLGVTFNSNYDVTESTDQSYVVDFGLRSDYEPFAKDLDKLSNSVERAVDHYRVSQRALLLYMNGQREISFRIVDKLTTHDNNFPIPVVVYPAAFPERKCTTFYSAPGFPVGLSTFCSNDPSSPSSRSDVCICVSSESCPKIIRRSNSARTTTETRRRLTCQSSVKYAYKMNIESMTSTSGWKIYSGRIKGIFKTSSELASVQQNQLHTFWLKDTCSSKKIKMKKKYLVIGGSVVEGNDGVFKHLFDSSTRMEQWPGKTNSCQRLSHGQTHTVCTKLNDYNYQMRNNGCPT